MSDVATGRRGSVRVTSLHAFVDVPSGVADHSAAFWGAVTGWPAGPPWRDHPELRSLLPPRGTAWLHVQEVDDAPRVHIDLEVPCGDAAHDVADQEVERLRSLGATFVRSTDDWVTLASPGGLPFCVPGCETAAGARAGASWPEPTTWRDGHRSRVRQICVDIPAGRWEAETTFWTAATRWRPEQTGRGPGESGRPEFSWLRPPAGPQQVLLQRMDEPSGVVRAHLDVATDDVAAEVRRVRDLGAGQHAADTRHDGRWVVLRDPAGLAFCITPQRP